MSRDVFSRAVDSLFLRLGSDAVYQTVEEPDRIIRVIARTPDQLLELGEYPIHSDNPQIEFRTSEVTNPFVGALITLDGRTYRIAEEPKKDLHHLIWITESLAV